MIKVIGDYIRKSINEDGDLEITIKIKNYNDKKRIDQLTKDTYQFEIKKQKSKRSLQQNALLWVLIHQIAEELQQDDMEVYISLLEEANAKFEYLLGLPTIEEELKRNFRAVKVVRPQEYQGKEMLVYKCFIGSSKFDTKEMTILIDKALEWCANLDIQVQQNEYYY